MEKHKYNWVNKLVNKITHKDFNVNVSFNYYHNIITIQSCTPDFMDVHINNIHNFSFDFWTKELIIISGCEPFKDILIDSFKEIYGNNMNVIEY